MGISDLKKLDLGEAMLIGYKCRFDAENYNDSLWDHYSIGNLSAQSEMLTNKRKAEFLAGRVCAQKCLLDLNFTNTVIEVGKNRAPIWPHGIVGSITHTSNTAVSVAALFRNYEAIGIDLEEIISSKIAEEINYQILGKEENQIFSNNTHIVEYSRFLTLVFSAKESIFKALHATVKNYFDFKHFQLKHLSPSKLVFVLKENLCQEYSRDHEVSVNFWFEENRVFTWVALQQP